MSENTKAHKVLQENARKAGKATFKKYGSKHYADLARKRWAGKKSSGVTPAEASRKAEAKQKASEKITSASRAKKRS